MLVCLLIFHLLYNIFLLNLFPEHRALFNQWSLIWTETVSTSLLADLFVGAFALWAVRNWKLARDHFSKPANRLLLVWFLVSIALVHHDLLLTPRQPVHFSRGYTWIPLFLLGVQPLLGMLEKCFSLKGRTFRVAALGCIFLIGLSDNIAWFGLRAAAALSPRFGFTRLNQDGFSLSPSDQQLYAWLKQRREPHTELLVTPYDNWPVTHLAVTYTDYRAWYSHFLCTPDYDRRLGEAAEFFRTGTPAPDWRGQNLFVILSNSDFHQDQPRWERLPLAYENEHYQVRTISFP
jgi:hypothetical protein